MADVGHLAMNLVGLEFHIYTDLKLHETQFPAVDLCGRTGKKDKHRRVHATAGCLPPGSLSTPMEFGRNWPLRLRRIG